MKISADQGGCYPPRPKAEVDNTLRDLQNSSHPTKTEFSNCYYLFKDFQSFKEEIEDITRRREDMNFMFEWQEQYVTRYCYCHKNIKFISSG